MEKKCETSYINVNQKSYPCAVSFVMDLIGGRWKGVILCHLKNGDKRFGELKKELSFITETTLSLQLRQLERDQLITRTVFGTKPPVKTVYSLSELGTSFIPLLDNINEWGKNILERKIPS
ncbi:helix-turn-helix transcriptional regulator [Chryseobacterium capnotolerans]|uniref:winged helix-turn-helix transcriptional regulator n=1 Tax=Chryseobacterium TaxID=59732 RepID=UPI00083B29E5|nr:MULTISPECIES: helix-turn-helix domain-containing protein [Chryseobacterium]UHO39242.1 helix-turn-helix transcriptional regulator [Chryseobacterium capnotolerans]